MSDIGLTLRQVRFTNRAFWRNPASAFFTFAFPLMFLVIFTTILGNGKTTLPGTNISVQQSTAYVAQMAAFALVSACYTNIAIGVVFQRDAGILKRLRGTPLPTWIYLAGRVIQAMLIALILVVITTAFGVVFYHSHVPSGADLWRLVITLLVGAGCFAAIGLAVSGLVPNADAGPPIVNAIMLPLLFVSDVFIPLGPHPAAWVDFVGKVFPVRHFVQAMQAAYFGYVGARFKWSDIAVMAAWGLVGVVFAARFFSWEPRK